MTLIETKALRILDQSPENSFPPGLMILWAGGAANLVPPTGWLLCDGSAVLRDLYPALFAAIGVSYGPGDGSTTFNLPGVAGAHAKMVSAVSAAQSAALTSASSEYSGHQHSLSNSFTANVSVNATHSHGAAACTTDFAFAGNHAINNAGSSSVGGGQTWNVGSSNRQSRNAHTHGGNAAVNYNHNSTAHTVSANVVGATEVHNAPTFTSGNQSTTSTNAGSWTPKYIDVWHIIKT